MIIMKRIFTSLLVIGVALLNAQLPVSQTPEKKKVVLEEFTGKTCQFCPDGHRIANDLKEANPDDVFLINIHTGQYASGTPNYRTDFGAALASQSGLGGYPAGTVNRYVFPGNTTTATGRGSWTANANTILGQDAIVNVACEAEIDVVSNILTVNVEAFYTGTPTASSNFLNVALTQDEIFGPQTGASAFYPEKIDPNTGLYEHGHMLRHMLTGQWGDEITSITQGTLVQKTYTYNLPADIGDVPVDIANLNVVAFMTETRQNILNAGGAVPTLVNLPNNLEAEMLSLTAPDVNCTGIVEPMISVRNFGQQDISSLEIKYSVNGGQEFSFNWSGAAVPPGYSFDVQLPQIGFSTLASNDLNVSIAKVNGSVDDITTNNDASATILAVDEIEMTQVTVEVTPDDYGSEISWKILDANGNVLDEVLENTYPDDDNTLKTKTVTLNALDCYTFELKDSYGDGLLGAGKVELKDQSSNLVLSIPGSSYSSIFEYKFATVDSLGNGNGNGDGSSVNPTAIRDLNAGFTFGLYPNPASSELVVDYDEVLASIKVINVLGKTVITADSKFIDVSGLPTGMYYVSLTNEEGSVVSKAFIKQ